MTNVDKQYNNLLEKIMKHGDERHTRAGDVLSLFGEQLKIDLKAGFPLLTTKKVFMKGIIHELLWFLQRPGSRSGMNIEYLIRNGVHIWDDDAYRWFKDVIVPAYHENIKKHSDLNNHMFVCLNDDSKGEEPVCEYWMGNEEKTKDPDWVDKVTKEEFLDLTLQRVIMRGKDFSIYRFGDLGPIYGTQWRKYSKGLFGSEKVDQIQNIIDTLKTNPFDRRMLCVAFNPAKIDEMALPPCHVMFQFYARKLNHLERLDWLRKNVSLSEDEYRNMSGEYMDRYNVPRYGLSCMWTQRSVDVCCGLPFNIASYALLTHIIAREVNMMPDVLIGSLGDCHIYKNHIDGVKEQLGRSGYDDLPMLKIMGNESFENLKADDIKIIDYECDPPIKFQLNVG